MEPLTLQMNWSFFCSAKAKLCLAKDHYDFGMRAVKTVISAAGNLKRENPNMNEVMIKTSKTNFALLNSTLFCSLTVFFPLNSAGVNLPAGHSGRQRPKIPAGRPEALQRHCVRPLPQDQTGAHQLRRIGGVHAKRLHQEKPKGRGR